MKFAAVVCVLAFAAGAARASIKMEPLRSGIALKPGETSTAEFAADAPMEFSWRTTQEKKCATDCLEMINKTSSLPPLTTRFGAGGKFTPVNGRVVLQFANKGDFPIVVEVSKVVRVCDAEACAFLRGNPPSRWLVFKIDSFTAIKTSADASYSTISGVTTTGKAFTLKAVWWTDDPRGAFPCARFIQRDLDQGTPKEKYSPYILSGQVLAGDALVLKRVEQCTPHAPHFGVLEQNVYK